MEKLVKRGRGRPKGSKNKVKKADKVEVAVEVKEASCCGSCGDAHAKTEVKAEAGE